MILSDSGQDSKEPAENLSGVGAGAEDGSPSEVKPKKRKEMQQPTSPQTLPAAEETISQIYEMIALTRERGLSNRQGHGV